MVGATWSGRRPKSELCKCSYQRQEWRCHCCCENGRVISAETMNGRNPNRSGEHDCLAPSCPAVAGADLATGERRCDCRRCFTMAAAAFDLMRRRRPALLQSGGPAVGPIGTTRPPSTGEPLHPSARFRRQRSPEKCSGTRLPFQALPALA